MNRKIAAWQSDKVAASRSSKKIVHPLGVLLSCHSAILSISFCMFLLSGCTLQWVDEFPPAVETIPSTITPPTETPFSEATSIDDSTRPMATPLSNGTGGDIFLGLSTEEQLALIIVPTRDLRDLALRLRPDINEIPLIVNQSAPDYAIGEQIEFWAHDLRENSNFQIMAELANKTDRVYSWVEVGESYDNDEVEKSLDRFSRLSYPAEIKIFGNEWNPGIDNDPRLHILHVTGVGNGVAGYYSSADQYSRLANPFSNQKEMFYINLDWLNRAKNYEYYETVLAHEFQHMIHWRNDRNEETWVNEGLSEFAQEVAEYEPDTIFTQDFISQPDTQLNTWGLTPGQNSEHYGSSYLFMAYFSQRFGIEAIQALVAHPANGIAGFQAVLKAIGYPNSFDQLFGEWVIANYVDDPDALDMDGVYGYHKLTLDTPQTDETYSTYPQTLASNVQNYATDYIVLENGESRNPIDLTLEFSGQDATKLVDAQPYSGRSVWWSSRGDDSDTRLTRRFDLRGVVAGSPVEMDVAMLWTIETNYDYGYALASVDGQKWDFLAGQRTTSENPSGNSFGLGYTGHSTISRGNSEKYAAEWVTERFDLSPYAGRQIWIRFEYVTDDAVSDSGWLIDDIRIPALGYETNFEEGMDGWESEGWLLTDNLLVQRWLLQIMRFDEEGQLQSAERVRVSDAGNVAYPIEALVPEQTAVLSISGLAPVTTEIARYEVKIRQSE